MPPCPIGVCIEDVPRSAMRRRARLGTNNVLGDFIKGPGDLNEDLALLGADWIGMIPASLGQTVDSIFGAIGFPGDARGSDCAELMLKQLDQELVPAILILLRANLNLGLSLMA